MSTQEIPQDLKRKMNALQGALDKERSISIGLQQELDVRRQNRVLRQKLTLEQKLNNEFALISRSPRQR